MYREDPKNFEFPIKLDNLYRNVGPDGRVTFSDKPLPGAAAGKVGSTGNGAAGDSNAALPFELRQAVARYPVTLYSAPDCSPCASGRAMLKGRGVPFSERTVTSADDSTTLKRITGDNSVPALTIGSQRLKGYSEDEWAQYLDAAGYPKSSVLPSGYRQPPASPLATVPKPTVKPAPEVQAESVPRPAPVDTGATNPAGIKF